MNLDDLLRLATSGGGTSSASTPMLRGADRAGMALPEPQPVAQPAMAPVPSSVSEASMGAPDLMERFARAGNDNPLLSPVSEMADLVGTILRGGHSGYTDMRRRNSIDRLQEDMDSRARLNSETQKKAKQEADATVAAESRKRRITDVSKARDESINQINAIGIALGLPASQERQTYLKNLAKRHQGKVKELGDVLARLTGDDSLEASGIDLSGMPGVPEKPEKGIKEDQGSYVTVKTPEGMRLMRQSEAASKGLLPINARDKRAASPTERTEFAKSVGMFSQIKSVADNYKKAFVGPAQGRLGSLGQKTGHTSGREAVFRSNLAALRNRLIKRDAGSAVTASEAQRLLQELPTENDPSGVFEAKFEAFQNALLEVARAHVQTLEASDIDTSGYPALPESTYTLGGNGRTRPPLSSFEVQ